MHCRQTILHSVFIGLVHLVRADPPGLTDPVAICIIGIGKAGGLLAIVELFRDQLVTLIILISVPLHNRSVQGFLHIGAVAHQVILVGVNISAVVVLCLRCRNQLSCSIVGKGAVCLHNLVGKGRILVMLCMLGAVGYRSSCFPSVCLPLCFSS